MTMIPCETFVYKYFKKTFSVTGEVHCFVAAFVSFTFSFAWGNQSIQSISGHNRWKSYRLVLCRSNQHLSIFQFLKEICKRNKQLLLNYFAKIDNRKLQVKKLSTPLGNEFPSVIVVYFSGAGVTRQTLYLG